MKFAINDCQLFVLFSESVYFSWKLKLIEVVSLNFDDNLFLKSSYLRMIWVNNC